MSVCASIFLIHTFVSAVLSLSVTKTLIDYKTHDYIFNEENPNIL